MKKLTALFLGIAMLLSLVACGNGTSSSPAESSSLQEETGLSTQETSSQETSSQETALQETSSQFSSDPSDEQPPEETEKGGTLVVYFSATGNTEEAASYIAQITGGDLFELEPADPYTDEDLDYGNPDSRVSREHEDESLREVELVTNTVDGLDRYDTVFIGYPIWWGVAAWPVDTFVESNDFTGKTVIPFCTSASSGLGESGELLAELAGTGNWQEGQRFSSRVSQEDVQNWLDGLDLFTSEAVPAATVEEEGSHTLIAYFTMPEDVSTNGVDAVAGASIVVRDGQVMGNVEYMAHIIQETVGGDLFRIETVQQYPLDHDPLVDQAAQEQEEEARPELSTHIENLDQYDTILLGYPNWWGDLPMPLYTFLETYDLSGKTIIPFCPHGGSGFSRTERTIAELQPGATVREDGLTISRNEVADSADQIASWAAGLGL